MVPSLHPEIYASLETLARQGAESFNCSISSSKTVRDSAWRNRYHEFQEGKMQSLNLNSLEDIK